MKLQPAGATLCAIAVSLTIAACSGSQVDMIAAARASIAGGKPDAAVIQLKNALQQDPASAEARFLLGETMLAMGDATAAAVELEKAAELGHPPEKVWPPIARAMLQLKQFRQIVDGFGVADLPPGDGAADLQTSVATALAAIGMNDKAEQAVDRALQLSPRFMPALLLQARLAVVAGDPARAETLLDALVKQDPKNHEAWQVVGDIRSLKPERAAETVDAYRKSVEIKPDHAPAQIGLMNALLRQRAMDAAHKQHAAMRKALPTHPQTMFFEAQLAYLDGDAKKSRDLMQQLLRYFPENPRMLQFAGLTEMKMGAPLQAEPYLAKAVQLAPAVPFTRRLLAAAYLETGQQRKLQEVLEPLLAASDVDALLIAAEAELQAGRFEQAVTLLKRAQQRRPDDPRTRIALALAELGKGNESTATADLTALATTDKDTVADKVLIASMIGRKNFDGALAATDRLEAKQPQRPDAAHLRGRVLLARKDTDGARKSFERALTIDANHLPSLLALASLDVQAKKPADAQARFEAVLKRDPKNFIAGMALADHLTRLGDRSSRPRELMADAVRLNPSDPQLRIVYADHLLQRGDGKAAQVAMQDALTAMPGNATILEALARLQLSNRDYEQAVQSLNKLTVARPGAVEPMLRLAEAYVSLNDVSSARRTLERVLQTHPDSLPAARGLVSLALLEKRPQTALVVARNVQQRRAKAGVGYALEGDILMLTRDPAGAAEAYRQGLQREPAPELAAKLHAALVTQGKTADAERVVVDWQRAHPKDPSLLFHLGSAAMAANQLPTAEARFSSVVEIQPKHAMALNNIAWLKLKQKQPGALAYAERAVAVLPNSPEVLDTLAQSLLDVGRKREALETERKAVALAPNNQALRLQLAKVALAAGEPSAAKTELQSLARLGEEFAEHAEVKRLLAAM